MTASEKIDNQISNLSDWRGQCFRDLRDLIHRAGLGIGEDWKWNTAVFTHNGNICAIGGFKDHIKINFFKGASLKDPSNLFNAGLEAKVSRAINVYEGDKLDSKAFQKLVREAVDANSGMGIDTK